VDWKWNDENDSTVQSLKAGYDRMFHRLLPEIVAREDPDRPYWPSSASSGVAFTNPNGQMRGDTHYWEVWHGRKPFTDYRRQFPRFMSEFGFQALPPFKTIQTYAEPKDQNMTSYVMEHHQRSPAGNGLMIGQMTDTFRMPRDFQSLVYLSMVLQAEGIRYGVEHWRRNRDRVSGTLIWQLNDCWPVASWSSLDYFGRWKALHYAARRFYAPVLLSIEDQAETMNVFLTNDTVRAFAGELRWSLQTINGKILQSGTEKASVKALSAGEVCSLDFHRQVTEAKRHQLVFVAELWKGARMLARQIATFCPNKHLELVDPHIETGLSIWKGQIAIECTAKSLARFVEVGLEEADVVFSDNYFDLPAGQSVTITCPLPPTWDLAHVRQSLQVRSLYDSF
jgi:beta-mannosidase